MSRAKSHAARPRVCFRKWGNSVAARLPKHVVAAAKISEGVEAEIEIRDGNIILMPVRRPRRYTLAELLDGVTPGNVDRFDWGPDRGKEILK